MVQAVCNISDGTVAPHAAIKAPNDWGGFTQHAFASVYKEGAVRYLGAALLPPWERIDMTGDASVA